jgi:hypothetical protein
MLISWQITIDKSRKAAIFRQIASASLAQPALANAILKKQ